MKHTKRISKAQQPASAWVVGITEKEGCGTLEGANILRCKLIVKNQGVYVIS